MNTTTWRSPHLDLRYLERSDLPSVATMLASDRVCEHLFFGPNSEAQTCAYFEPLLDAMEPALSRGERPPLHCFALLEPGTGVLMGEGAVLPVDFAEGAYMVGYQLDEPYWGRRYGTWAARFLVAHAVLTLGARRVTAECFATNVASARILEGVGLRREGVLRAHYLKDGEPRDNLLYGMLRDEADVETLTAWRDIFAPQHSPT